MRLSYLSLVILYSTMLFAQNNPWQKVLSKTEENLVTIEYYEEIISPESITDGNKVKRHLNGIIVDQKGLILTSASIYQARMDFSSSSQFGPENPPSDISVTFKNNEAVPAHFIGKDDDKGVAFIRTEKPLNSKGISFENPEMHLGDKLYFAYQLDEEYNQQIFIMEKSVNSIIPGPPLKLLTEMAQQVSFGLVYNAKGNAIGVLISDDPLSYHGFTYPAMETNYAEILTAPAFNALVKNPPEYRKKDTNRKKWLGVTMQPFTRSLARYFNQDKLEGILINTVLDDSPAKKAGIQVGDVVTEFNGVKLSAEKDTDLQTFRNLIRESDGEQVTFKIWREGSIQELSFKLAEIPISQFLADEASNTLLGFSAKELTKDIILAKQLASGRARGTTSAS